LSPSSSLPLSAKTNVPCSAVSAIAEHLVELVARRIKIKKLNNNAPYNKTVQYKTRNEMQCNAMRKNFLARYCKR